MRYVLGILLSICGLMQISLIIVMVRRTTELNKAISKSNGKPITSRFSNDEVLNNNERILKYIVLLIILLLPLTMLIFGLFANNTTAIIWALMEFVFISIASTIIYGIERIIQRIKQKRNEKHEKSSR